MMKSNDLVEVISTEIIKPSSPTPPHLRIIKRSYLDLILLPMHVPLVFFYQKPDHDEAKTITSQRLKESLSRTLTSFYPLAGRIQDNHTVDCNDSGVVFIEARARAQLEDAIQDPHAEEALKQYLPLRDPATTDGALFLVQVNFFDDGGIVVGVYFSHEIADFASIMSFIKAWAGDTTCRQETDDEGKRICPSFDLANYFPGRGLPSLEGSSFFMSDEKFTTKRFVFDEKKLLALRGMHVADDDVNKEHMRPSRVELVSAFIWKTLMNAESSNNNLGAIFTAFHGVNLRPRKSPPH